MDLIADISEIVGFGVAMDLFPDELDGEMTWSSYVILHEGIGFAMEAAPVDRGDLKNSIHILEGPDSGGGSYGTDAVHAWQREEGGDIYPRNGEFLWFEVNGELVRARKVTQEGSHYMQESMDRLEPRVLPIYALAVDRLLGRI